MLGYPPPPPHPPGPRWMTGRPAYPPRSRPGTAAKEGRVGGGLENGLPCHPPPPCKAIFFPPRRGALEGVGVPACPPSTASLTSGASPRHPPCDNGCSFEGAFKGTGNPLDSWWHRAVWGTAAAF